jgi:hypothetical protein
VAKDLQPLPPFFLLAQEYIRSFYLFRNTHACSSIAGREELRFQLWSISRTPYSS